MVTKVGHCDANYGEGTYPNYVWGRLSVSDENVNRVTCGICHPPGLDIIAKYGIQFGSSLLLHLSRRAREPRQEQCCGGSGLLEGHERFADSPEIGLILR